MSELKRCPCCGGEAEIRQRYIKYNGVVTIVFEIKCKRCCMRSMAFFEKEEAIETWNTREPVDDVLERLEDMITFAENMPPVRDEYSAIPYEKAENFIEAYKDAIEIVKEVMGYD